METNVQTKNGSYNEDLATYLDKLLRQDYRHRPQAPSRPSWEHTRKVVPPSLPEEVIPPVEKTEPPELEAPKANPVEAKPIEPVIHPKVSKSKPKKEKKKRPKQTLRLRKPKTQRKRVQRNRNARQKAMVALIPVLGLALLMVVQRSGNSSTILEMPAGIDMTKTFPETDPEITIDWQVPPPYQPTDRDPMAMGTRSLLTQSVSTSQDSTPANLVVKGILYSVDRPAVIIGTSLLHPGDQVLGATIVNINKDSVEFEADGRTWTQTVTPAKETPNTNR